MPCSSDVSEWFCCLAALFVAPLKRHQGIWELSSSCYLAYKTCSWRCLQIFSQVIKVISGRYSWFIISRERDQSQNWGRSSSAIAFDSQTFLLLSCLRINEFASSAPDILVCKSLLSLGMCCNAHVRAIVGGREQIVFSCAGFPFRHS